MTRTEFDHEIQNARDQILQLGNMVVGDLVNMERGDYALWAAHNLERTVFLSTGKPGELSDTFGHRERY